MHKVHLSTVMRFFFVFDRLSTIFIDLEDAKLKNIVSFLHTIFLKEKFKM